MVPRRGLEPPRLSPLVPETSASTNSATWATRLSYEADAPLVNGARHARVMLRSRSRGAFPFRPNRARASARNGAIYFRALRLFDRNRRGAKNERRCERYRAARDGVRRVGIHRTPCGGRSRAGRLARARRLPASGPRLFPAAAGQGGADFPGAGQSAQSRLRRRRRARGRGRRQSGRRAGRGRQAEILHAAREGRQGRRRGREAAGVRHFVHVSAIGADKTSHSVYARTKAEGEAAIRGAFPARSSCARPSSSARRISSSTDSPPSAAICRSSRSSARRPASSRSMSAMWRMPWRWRSTAAPRPARPMSSAARR